MQNSIDINDMNIIFGLKSADTQIIVGGDFNAHHPLWLSNTVSPNGTIIYNWYADNFSDLSISLNSSLHPTRHCNESHTYLDLFFVSSSLNIIYPAGYTNHLKTVPFESDHDALILTISLNDNYFPSTPVTVNNYALTNWKNFNNKIEEKIKNIFFPCNRNLSNEEIDVLLEKITDILQNTINEEVPKTTIKQAGQIPLPNYILLVIKYKNKLRRIWHRQKYTHTNLTISSQIKCLNIMIKQLISNYYNEYYSTKLSNIKPDNNLKKFKKILWF